MPAPILVLIGPSGSGKSTMAERLSTHVDPSFYIHRKCTTRPPRKGEVSMRGEDIFVSDAEFSAMVKNKEFLEVVQPFGLPYKYGIKAIPDHDKDITLVLLRSFVIDLFKKYYPSLLVYQLTAPLPLLAQRMNNRLQSGEDIDNRILSAKHEITAGKLQAKRTFITDKDISDRLFIALAQDLGDKYNGGYDRK